MRVDNRTAKIFIIVSCTILALAFVWALTRGSHTELDSLCNNINAFGYSFCPDDMLISYDNANTTIENTLNTTGNEQEYLCGLSRSAGFNGDIKSIGGVTLILAKYNSDIITIYLLDGEIQLCFVQRENGELLPINYKES